jgi:hypothetical protein
LLSFDETLGPTIPQRWHDLADRALRVPVLEVPVGEWKAPELARGSLGFLIGRGLLTREVQLDGARSLEPLGPGDLLRPWQEDGASFVTSVVIAQTPARVAIFDGDFAALAARFPGLVATLMERVMQRCRYLSVYAAIDGLVGVHRRLTALMWTLAERWGTIRAGEVFLPVELHHSALAYLVSARRPSVSTALAKLQRDGVLTRVEGGWIIRGDPPGMVRAGSGADARG